MNKYGDGSVDATETKEEIQDKLRTFYLIAKSNAFYVTLCLIATFVAETILNTIRLNHKLASLLERVASGWEPLQYFQGFYPVGDKQIEIVSAPMVYIYIFAVALYTGLRLVHHKTMANEPDWPGEGDERKKNMAKLGPFTRWCYMVTPRRRIHVFVMRMWMWWGIIPLIVMFPLSWLGIRVFTSDHLITALVGSVMIFGVNLIQDTNFFKKVPAKDFLGKMALSLVTLGFKKDFKQFWQDLSTLFTGISSGEMEVTREDIEDIHRLTEWAYHLAQNPECGIRPPVKTVDPMLGEGDISVRG